MRKMEDLIQGESGVFGPGTDLVVSLAAVLILILAIKSMLHREDMAKLRRLEKELEEQQEDVAKLRRLEKELEVQQEDMAKLRRLEEELEEQQRGQLLLTQVLENQRSFVEEVAERFNTEATPLDEDVYAIDIDGQGSYDIVFYNHVDRQRITFGSHILFDPDEVNLSAGGRHVLVGVSEALANRIDDIREVHIEGHADTSPTRRHRSNLDLAAKRAITVFRALEDSGIDPHEIIMSATSYGEYLSVERFRISRTSNERYSLARILRDNRTREQKRLNRRIEVRLIYTLEPRDEPRRASLWSTDQAQATPAR